MGNRRLYPFLLPPLLVVLLLVFGRGPFSLFRAELVQSTTYGQYAALKDNIAKMRLTVQENGETVGVYDLETLGLLKPAQEDLEATFDPISQMPPDAFRALSKEEKLNWQPPADPVVVLRSEEADLSAILDDLNQIERFPPQDAYTLQDGDQHIVVPAKPGTQLDSEALPRELRQALKRTVKPDSPLHPILELSELPIYQTADATQENELGDKPLPTQDMAELKIPLTFFRTTRELDVSKLVSLSQDGRIQVDENGLAKAVAALIPKLSPQVFGYLFDSSIQGEVPLDFLPCTYEADEPALLELLKEQIARLDTSPLEVPKHCLRDGKPYTMGKTYLEVDIRQQKMTYIKDGKQVLQTDVVTGYPFGRWTPPGQYAVLNKKTDTWLYGVDYTVFVEYWVGYDGHDYGVHDASWRDSFGGDIYLSDGSHGCVNTPTEAMKALYDMIEVGDPVIIFDAQPLQ